MPKTPGHKIVDPFEPSDDPLAWLVRADWYEDRGEELESAKWRMRGWLAQALDLGFGYSGNLVNYNTDGIVLPDGQRVWLKPTTGMRTLRLYVLTEGANDGAQWRDWKLVAIWQRLPRQEKEVYRNVLDTDTGFIRREKVIFFDRRKKKTQKPETPRQYFQRRLWELADYLAERHTKLKEKQST